MLQPAQPQIFRVAIGELAAGPRRLEARLDAAWLDWAFTGCEYPVRSPEASVEIDIEAVSGGVLVRGQARVGAETDCGICLACARLDLVAEIGCFMMRRPEGVADDGDEELTPEDLEREWYDGDSIILDEIVRDAIMLELPMTPRCRSDCSVPDMLAAGGGDGRARHIDPRLAPLAGFWKNAKESD